MGALFNDRFREDLYTKTKTAFCKKIFLEFDEHIQEPHGTVHVTVGGNMRDINYASYDPIFYMHHMNVDRQYAYYQALQKVRGRSVTLPSYQNIEMTPFSGKTKEATEDINIPNPIKSTQDYSTFTGGLNYDTNFQYQYDSLTFGGTTPDKFDSKHCGSPGVSVKVNKNGTSSKNIILANIKQTGRGRRSTKGKNVIFGQYVILTEKGSNYFVDIDLSPSYESNYISFDDNTIHFTVESYDFENNIIENNAFKPTVSYTNSDGEIVMSYHTDYLSQYNPNIKIANLRTKVAFRKNDGTFCEGVKLVVSEYETVTVKGPIQITSTKQEFLYSGNKIECGINLNAFLEVGP